jgi:pimeloyl-ACP methyl ester carboxylesterase
MAIEHLDSGPVHLVGDPAGGNVACNVAARRPTSLRRL